MSCLPYSSTSASTSTWAYGQTIMLPNSSWNCGEPDVAVVQWLACLSCKRETAVQIPVVAHFYGNLLIFIEGSISPCIDFYHRMFCFPSVNCESIAFPQPPPISLVSDCTGYGARSKNAVVTVSDSEGLITEMADNLCIWYRDRKSTRLNSSHVRTSRMPSSAWKKKNKLQSITPTSSTSLFLLYNPS